MRSDRAISLSSTWASVTEEFCFPLALGVSAAGVLRAVFEIVDIGLQGADEAAEHSQ